MIKLLGWIVASVAICAYFAWAAQPEKPWTPCQMYNNDMEGYGPEDCLSYHDVHGYGPKDLPAEDAR